MAWKKNLEGQRFGRLVVQSLLPVTAPRGYRLWKCICDCGNAKNASTETLNSGRTRSCGCLQREAQKTAARANALPEGVSLFNALYDSYKRNAAYRGWCFDLSKDQVKALFAGTCHYCGAPPGTVFKQRTCVGTFVFNGIDRTDPTKGYVVDNVVTACKMCNYIKAGRDYQEFLDWVARVARHRRIT